MKKIHREYLTFLLVCAVILTVYAVHHIAPFGDRSILWSDLYHQYAPFLKELRDKLLHGESLFYSWSTGLGKDFLVQAAYYTASPLDLLVLCFPGEHLSEGVAVLITLKTALCGMSFSWYLRKRFQKNDSSIIVFGLLYAFCGFVTCYYWNIMWLDTVILFPAAVLGTHRLLERKKPVLLYVSLILTIWVNFYLAAMVFAFLTLFIFIQILTEHPGKAQLSQILCPFLRFLLVSVLAILSCAVILLPVILALAKREGGTLVSSSPSIYSNIFQLLDAHFAGARPSVLSGIDDMPNIYSGVLTMILLPVYLWNRNIPRREKILKSGFLLFMMLCCVFNWLVYLVHGFQFPRSLPHRFVFMYSFFLLVLAYEAFSRISFCKMRFPITAVLFYLLCMILSEFCILPHLKNTGRVLDNSDIILNVCLLLIYLSLLFLMTRGSAVVKKITPYLLLTCILAEGAFAVHNGLVGTTPLAEASVYPEDTSSALTYAKEKSESLFYRTEFRLLYALNEGALYGYRGVTGFSSLMPGNLTTLMKNLGIASQNISIQYYDLTPLTDAMLDVRYILDRDEETSSRIPYTRLKTFDHIALYENDTSLPLSFRVDDMISDWQATAVSPFDVQNSFVKTSTGITGDLFTPIEPDALETSYMLTEPIDGSNYFSYELTAPEVLPFVPAVTASYTMPEDTHFYFYIDSEQTQRVEYETSSGIYERNFNAGNSMIDVGWLKKGETVKIYFSVTRRGEQETSYRPQGTVKLYAAAWNEEVFERAYEVLAEDGMEIIEFSDTHIKGTIVTREDGTLFTSIPYSDGWTVSVDGTVIETQALGGALLGIKLEAGSHIIRFDYLTPGLVPGLALSLAGIALFLVFYYFSLRQQAITASSQPNEQQKRTSKI